MKSLNDESCSCCICNRPLSGMDESENIYYIDEDIICDDADCLREYLKDYRMTVFKYKEIDRQANQAFREWWNRCD